MPECFNRASKSTIGESCLQAPGFPPKAVDSCNLVPYGYSQNRTPFATETRGREWFKTALGERMTDQPPFADMSHLRSEGCPLADFQLRMSAACLYRVRFSEEGRGMRLQGTTKARGNDDAAELTDLYLANVSCPRTASP